MSRQHPRRSWRFAFFGLWLLPALAFGLSGNEQVELGATGEFVGLMRGLEQKAQKQALRTPDQHALCYAYAKAKVYRRLFACLDQLEARARSGDKRTRLFGLDDVTPYIHLMRGEAQLELAQYRASRQAAQAALDWYKAEGGDEATVEITALGLLALAARFDGDEAGAAFAAERLERIDVAWPFRHAHKPAKEAALSRVYMALGRYQQAYDLLAADKLLAAEAFLDNLASGALLRGKDYWRWRLLPRNFMKYKALYQLGRHEEAEKGYRALLAVPQTEENGDIHWLILRDLGDLARRRGDLHQAAGHYARAIEVVERYRTSIQTEASKIGFVGDKAALYSEMVQTLLEAGRTEAAFEYVERSKSRALVDLLASKEGFAAAPETQALLTGYGEAEAQARLQFMSEEAGGEGVRSLGPLTERLAHLRRAAPELASLVSVSSAGIGEIGAGLAPDEALVEYHYDAARLSAYVVRAGQVRHIALDRAGLEGEVHALREAIQGRQDAAQAITARLYQRLIQPLTPALIGVARLTLAPHGVLHYLPFASLTGPEGVLSDRYRLRNLPSASVLRYLRPAAVPTGPVPAPRILVVGNPKTAQNALPHAEQEARRVAESAPDATLRVGEAASETAFRQEAGAFRRLHLATHGRFSPDAPLESALLFTRDDANDGLLTLAETYDLRLDADLVTLSACETGLGVVAGGDDVIGLTRGFLYAGARSVVASLWPVDDSATARLMTGFYARLNQGVGKGEALRLAQRALRESQPAPYYWAGFYLTGVDD